jgi:uncharacterized paraquat-inducible protein A
MDARPWNGDEDRDWPSVADRCDQCECEMFPEERADGRCSRCAEDAYAEQRARLIELELVEF